MFHSFTFICSNFSYFNHSVPKGPKSFLKLIELLQKQAKVTLIIIGRNDPVDLAFSNVEVITSKSFFSLFVKNNFFFKQQSAIIVDRAHILHGLIIKLIYGKPIVIRMLGRGRRLQSKRIFSLRNLLSIITKLIKPDLLIETIDLR